MISATNRSSGAGDNWCLHLQHLHIGGILSSGLGFNSGATGGVGVVRVFSRTFLNLH